MFPSLVILTAFGPLLGRTLKCLTPGWAFIHSAATFSCNPVRLGSLAKCAANMSSFLIFWTTEPLLYPKRETYVVIRFQRRAVCLSTSP